MTEEDLNISRIMEKLEKIQNDLHEIKLALVCLEVRFEERVPKRGD